MSPARPASRSSISSAMMLRWSIMLLRRTSVGWAVSTGTTSDFSSSLRIASSDTPCSSSRLIALATSAPGSLAMPCRSSARLASIEKSMKPRTKASVSSSVSAESPESASAVARPPRALDRRGTDRLGLLKQPLAAISANHIAKQPPQIANVGILRDRRTRRSHGIMLHCNVRSVKQQGSCWQTLARDIELPP